MLYHLMTREFKKWFRENESLKKRIDNTETRIKDMEKRTNEKEEQINKLVWKKKQLQRYVDVECIK